MLIPVHPIISQIMEKLFEAEGRRLNATLIKLNQDNREITKSFTDGFIFQGKRYIPRDISLTLPGRGGSITALHFDLFPRMDLFIWDKSTVVDDKHEIRLALFNSLEGSERLQDIRDALPECLIPYYPGLTELNRQREPGWILPKSSRAYRQLHKALPKIDMYAAGRLLY